MLAQNGTDLRVGAATQCCSKPPVTLSVGFRNGPGSSIFDRIDHFLLRGRQYSAASGPAHHFTASIGVSGIEKFPIENGNLPVLRRRQGRWPSP